MRHPAELALPRADDATAAGVAAVALGTGAVVALAGAARGELLLLALGAAGAATALVVLIAAGWLDGLLLLTWAAPLPALFSTDTFRLPVVAPLTAAVVFGWALRLGSRRRPLANAPLPRTPLLLLGAVFLAASAFAVSPALAVRESINFLVLLALFVLAVDMLTGDAGRIDRLVLTLLGVGVLCALLAVLESLRVLPGEFPRWGTDFNRAALGLGQPNGLGLFLALILPLAAHQWRAGGDAAARLTGAAATAILGAGLIATFSRGSWIALLGGASVFILTRDARMLVRIWLAAIVLAVVVDVVSGGVLRHTFEQTIGDWVIEQRAALMLAGVLMFLAHPLLGVGPGNYAVSLEEFGPQVAQLWDYLPTPHNAYVQMAAETGLPGLVILVVFQLAVLRRLVRGVKAADAESGPRERSLRRALLWSWATSCTAGFFIWPWAHGTGQIVVLLGAAGLAASALHDERRRNDVA